MKRCACHYTSQILVLVVYVLIFPVFLLSLITKSQCRRFIAEQFSQAGLNLHKEKSPVEIKRQPNSKLTVVVKSLDGSLQEIADNDQVLMATGMCSFYQS
jgi:hypothetical protein